MLLQVLRALEGLATEVAFVRLEWHVYSNVRGNVISLDCCRTAVAPLTGQIQIVGTFAANMALTDMVLEVVVRMMIAHNEATLVGGNEIFSIAVGRVATQHSDIIWHTQISLAILT
jgi:hypothetical protein